MLNNRGHINLGISCDTAAFACDSFARYWSRHGRRAYVADAGHHRQAFFREALARMKQPPTGKQLEWTWAVDYYHAAERITTMAEAIFGAGREASAASGSIQSGLVANLWVHICPFSLRRQPKPHSGKLTNASIFPWNIDHSRTLMRSEPAHLMTHFCCESEPLPNSHLMLTILRFALLLRARPISPASPFTAVRRTRPTSSDPSI